MSKQSSFSLGNTPTEVKYSEVEGAIINATQLGVYNRASSIVRLCFELNVNVSILICSQ